MRLLLAACRAELVERGSRFLALAHPAVSLDDALAVRDAERRHRHDATHHVYAALDAARTRRVIEGEIRYIVYEFGDTGAVARVLEAGAAVRGSDEYGSGVRTEVRIPRGSGPDFDRRVRDATAGRAGLVPDDTPDSCWITVSA